jgi:hypothetical protein
MVRRVFGAAPSDAPGKSDPQRVRPRGER